MTWMHKIRLRVFALVVAFALAAIGVISWAALPVLPVIGVTVAAVALVVNTMTSRLSHPTCWGCGGNIAKQPESHYGVECPNCGTLTPVGARLARTDSVDRQA